MPPDPDKWKGNSEPERPVTTVYMSAKDATPEAMVEAMKNAGKMERT